MISHEAHSISVFLYIVENRRVWGGSLKSSRSVDSDRVSGLEKSRISREDIDVYFLPLHLDVLPSPEADMSAVGAAAECARE